MKTKYKALHKWVKNKNGRIYMKPMSNLRRAIFYLQQALREKEYLDDPELLKALDILAKKVM